MKKCLDLAKKSVNSMSKEKNIHPTDLLSSLNNELGAEISLAQQDLHQLLAQKRINPDIAGVLSQLDPLDTLVNRIKSSFISKSILSTLVISTGARLISEQPESLKEVARIILDNAVAWAGVGIDKLELTSIILGASAAAVWTLLPPFIYEGVLKRENKRLELIQQFRDGKADLTGKVGPNIQIDVGKSDPSALLLTRLFHLMGVEVVSFWDQENFTFKDYGENPYWERTGNDWTNRATLLRGDLQESLCSVTLVSNGDDIFLSSRKQDPKRKTQDMTDDEAINTVNARNSVREQLGLAPIQHIIVTNPQRTLEIGVARHNSESLSSRKVEQVLKNKENVHLIDPDMLMIQQLADIAFEKKGEKDEEPLPLELVTNPERKKEYQEYLENLIIEHNQRVDQGLAFHKIRIADDYDGLKTLSIFYGSKDDNTITALETYIEDFSQEGTIIAIIYDPEKITRLPKGVPYLCVGTIVAQQVIEKFSDLISQGKIIPPEVKKNYLINLPLIVTAMSLIHRRSKDKAKKEITG